MKVRYFGEVPEYLLRCHVPVTFYAIVKVSKSSFNLDLEKIQSLALIKEHWASVADLGGGMGGMHPPHQPKSYDFGRKISPNLE